MSDQGFKLSRPHQPTQRRGSNASAESFRKSIINGFSHCSAEPKSNAYSLSGAHTLELVLALDLRFSAFGAEDFFLRDRCSAELALS